MTRSVFAACLCVCFLTAYGVEAAEKSDEKKPLGGSTPRKFEASSLWGIRRGPNAPKALTENISDEKDSKKKKDARAAYFEEEARQAYLRSLSRTPGSSGGVGVSSPKQPECARKK